MQKVQNVVRLSPAPLVEGPTSGPFRFLKNNTDKIRTEFMLYKPPKLKGVWPNKFVEYYYRDPETDKWQRFKVYEEINRNKSKDYDHRLLEGVRAALKKGYNPFVGNDPYTIALPEQPVYTIHRALLFFIGKWKERGLDDTSMKKYNQAVDLLITWLTLKGIQFMPAAEITSQHIEDCLRDAKIKSKWGNRTYNNYKSFLSTAFIYLVKKKIVPANPCSEVATQKFQTKKHKYYDAKTLPKVMQLMQKVDEYLHFAAQVVYHLCVRSEKELRNLKVGNIFPDRMQVLLEVTKGKADRYIPMNDQILTIMKGRGVLKLPANYYLFSGKGSPGPVPFGNGFFSKRFRKIRQSAGLSEDSTLYGFKHTRVIHLKKDGAADDEIMALTGHKDFAAYASYLRDLGADVNPEKIHKLSRSI